MAPIRKNEARVMSNYADVMARSDVSVTSVQEAPPVALRLMRANEGIETLFKAISELTTRLEPVLRPENTLAVDGDADSIKAAVTCKLAGQLEDMSWRIAHAADKIDDLLKRLEV